MSTRREQALNARDVATAVRRHFGAEHDTIGPEWAALDEFSLATGVGHQRADLFLVRAWPGLPKGHERIAVEIKVSRSDLLSELAKPAKSEPFRAVAHRFYLAVANDILRESDDIPAEWGILSITGTGICRQIRKATRREDPAPLPEPAVVEAFRRAARSEARIRNADGEDTAALVPDLQRRVASAEMALHRAKRAADKAKQQNREIFSLIAGAGGWVCVCGLPMAKPRDVRYGSGLGAHADGSTTCAVGRYNMPEYDYAALAARLGLPDPTAQDDREEDDAVA